ncbi:MAG TPA: DUF2934 domain-containing protein [Burkholderiales bacterium]|nr:DUF2934 domain-containing protein [Burkholderiales bacterium]
MRKAHDERRHTMIAQAAHFLAQRRGFTPCYELEDWLAQNWARMARSGPATGKGASPAVTGASGCKFGQTEARMMGENFWFFGMHAFWWSFWLVVVVAIIYLLLSAGQRRERGESAREVLDRRYAAGEISTQEYEERKEKLTDA